MTIYVFQGSFWRTKSARRAFYIGKQIADYIDVDKYYFADVMAHKLTVRLRKAAAHSWSRGGKKWKGGR